MGFNNFRLQILIRVLVLIFFLLCMLWSVYFTEWEVTPLACALLSVLAVVELIHFIEKSNRRLNNFLNFIHHRDFSNHYTDNQEGQTFTDLSLTYQFITDEFKRLNAEKEANSQYLELVLEHINVALLCLNEKGVVTLMNRQAKHLFAIPYLHSVDGLKKIDSELYELVNNMGNGAQHLIQVLVADVTLHLSVHVTKFQLLDKSHKLISFQNIRSELEQHEISSWQKLIRVLTHEIMNSVTPIISLSGVLKEKFAPDENDEYGFADISPSSARDIHKSINSIESRSKGLNDFIQTYRRLTAIPKPQLSIVDLSSILDDVSILLSPELDKRSVALQVSGNTQGLLVKVDPHQIEQVLINLILNAMQALASSITDTKTAGLIKLEVESTVKGSILIKVIDNGPGISFEYLDQIFVPFFTTRQEGTGIGLSLSRQLCIQNNVLLALLSSSVSGCIFQLEFQCIT